MKSFWNVVNKVIDECDLLIEVLDARHINESRNYEIEKKVLRQEKILLYVINKCDLVDVNKLKKVIQLKPCVYISSKEKLGTTILLKKILELRKGEQTLVGVLGYPNVGKSSLINAITGRGAARTSSMSGYTKGVQRVKLNGKLSLLDSPGVFPYGHKNEKDNALIGSIDYARIRDPETVSLEIIIEYLPVVQKYYGIDSDDEEEILAKIAIINNKLKKGGKPNIELGARAFLRDIQTGKLKLANI